MAEPQTYRYPLTKLDSADDYLRITAIEYKAPGFSSPQNSFAAPTAGDPNDKKTPLDYFILPIPDDIKDTNATSWGESSLNPLELATRGLVGGAFSSKSMDEAYKKAISAGSKVFGEATSGSVQKYLQALGINAASNILLGGNKDQNEIFSRYAGAVTNSNIELIFTGVSIRQPFSFAFDMVPRSQKEAQVIKQIIRKFKQYSAGKKQAAGTGNGLFLKAPDVFRLEYMNGGNPHPYLNRFKICALTGVSVNYTNGNYATYSDGAPVNIVLGLTFKELSPIYAEDYDTGIGKEGTGF